jgi:serine/threonine-protein kinase
MPGPIPPNRGRRKRGVALALLLALAGPAGAAPAPRFPSGAVWHQDISTAPVHPSSQAMLATLAGLGGWGNGNRFQIDFSLHVYQGATAATPRLPVVPHAGSGEYYSPDCEALPTTMPVPADAAFEGQAGLSCDNNGGDCHLLVREGSTLYELYNGNLVGGTLNARCLAVWQLNAVYPPQGRGEHCTSADAAGFPMAPLLVNADGVAAAIATPGGDLGHAIRFILPNARMATDPALGGIGGRLYVRPASHAGSPGGPIGTVPYGTRLRLRADFDMTGYNPAAQVILRTMQRYGIVLSDGGNIALTFESDRHTTASWSSVGVSAHMFWNGSAGNRTPVQVTDFQVLDTGPRIGETWNCVRTTVAPQDLIFADGFD